MPRKVFVSYSHKQGEWVWDRLVPALEAADVHVEIDVKRFKAGGALYRQMDAAQDRADFSLLVLSPDYLASTPCKHEMKRAVDRNPTFDPSNLQALPLVRINGSIPARIKKANPLWIGMEDDTQEDPWDKLLGACGASLASPVPDWLSSRDEIKLLLERNESVNLHSEPGAAWAPLLHHLEKDVLRDLRCVDLEAGNTNGRRLLVETILRKFGSTKEVLPPPEDLGALHDFFSNSPVSRLALTHFDALQSLQRRESYGIELFWSLRNLVSTQEKLVLLISSHAPFVELLPSANPLSGLDLKTVRLRSRR